MPQSLRKSFTAWLQLPALPPTPNRNSLPPCSRNEASSSASFSTTSTSTVEQIFSTSARKSRLCDVIVALSNFSPLVSGDFQRYRTTGEAVTRSNTHLPAARQVRLLSPHQCPSIPGPCGRANREGLQRAR